MSACESEQDILKLDKIRKEVLEELNLDLSSLDAFELDGFAEINNPDVEQLAREVAQARSDRQTQLVLEGARSRVLGVLDDPEFTTEDLQSVSDRLSTRDGGSIKPSSRKPVLMDALAQEIAEI